MSETSRISPMLDNFDMGGPISEHDGVFSYPAMHKDTDDRYIVKKVAIPASQKQLDALLLTGAFPDAPSALTYFKELADRTVEELETLRHLSTLEGFLSYEDWQVNAMTDAIGFEVCMLGSYKRTLRKHFKKQPMTHLGAVNLGLDLCTALAVCRRSGYLYVDLKPNNVYVLDEQKFRIGDIGFIALDSLSYASLPDKYRSEYTAPELEDAFSMLNSTIDIYALGLILYQVYNGNALPEKDEDGKFPAPLNADYEMAEIILKACDPDPAARWQDPIEMGQALVSYMQRNGANDIPIVPPTIPSVDDFPVIDDIDLSDIDLSDISDYEVSDEALADDAMLAEEEQTPVAAAVEVSGEIPVPEEEPVTERVLPPEEIAAPEIPEPLEEIPESTIAEETAAAEDVPAEEQPSGYEEDSFGNLSFLDVENDETSPEHNVGDVPYGEISDELSEILAQADALVSHEIPAPAVAPEPTQIVIPEPIAAEEAPQNEADPVSEADTGLHEEAPSSQVEVSMEETLVVPVQATESDADESFLQKEDEEEPFEDEPFEEAPVKKKKSAVQIALNVVIIVLLLAIVAVGFFYYRNIYLLPIDSLSITGDESSMIIQLDSGIDESLLSVVCSDSHGNQISAPVVNGTATFANLSPDTAYNVHVLVDGFHRLTGETAASYSTPAQSKIVQFNAVTGSEDGSVVLSFTVEGPDTGDWSVVYSAADEPEQTIPLLSHMATITGLTIGKEYTFTLVPGADMYVTGQTDIKFTASELVYAENVNIVSFVDNAITVSWTAPESASIMEWTVRCYDDADYNETVITADTAVRFENIDPSRAYTVEVIAAGMSLSQRAYMSANAITVTNFAVDADAKELVLTWDSSYEVPDGGWVLMYSVDNSAIQSSLTCTENRAVISPVVPNATYTFTLQLANGNTVLTTPLQHESAKAKDFSGYGMIRSSMTYRLCERPDKADWDRKDLSDSDYTSTFQVGEPISIVGQLHDTYGISSDDIVILYVFRDADGNAVSYCYTESHWNEMWYKYYGEFDVPQAPTDPGDYTLSIYFNGKLVANKKVTIEGS